jgi:Na+/glutamate symporter
MKNSPLTTILLVGLAVCALVSLFCTWQWIGFAVEARRLQGQVNGIQMHRAGVMALANDAIEYSKSNHAIDPILDTVRTKTPAAK